jgi:hypothetical protein
MLKISNKFIHGIDPHLFSGDANEALQRLLTGDWDGFEVVRSINAINSLHECLRESVMAKKAKVRSGDFRNLKQKVAAMSTPEEIRRCMYELGEVWAILWFNRGQFYAKYDYYIKKERSYSLRPIDEVFLRGLQKLEATLKQPNG